MKHDSIAQAILDANKYMTLATADASGRPWASPVWYAHAAYRELFWVSNPDATHSRNLAQRPELAIVVFDSQVTVGEGQAVYMSAVAEQPSGAELERGMDVFSRRTVEQGNAPWTVDDVSGSSHLRLYRATVQEHFILDPDHPRDVRTRVTP